MSSIKFFTVGYGNFVTREEFIKALVDHGITVVVDVGRSTGRKRKGFGASLAYELVKQDMGKLDIPSLSNPYLDMEEYSSYIEGSGGIDQVVDLIVGNPGLRPSVVVIMCVCEDPNECHRTMIARHVVNALVGKGYTAGYEDIGK